MLKDTPGTYALVSFCQRKKPVKVGHWGELEARRGYYVYIGSAFGPGGVRARVSRHCREDKPKRWHIDYLRAATQAMTAWYTHDVERLEHRWAQAMLKRGDCVPIDGFGCSDCRCRSHLFFFPRKPEPLVFRESLAGDIQRYQCPCSVPSAETQRH